MSYSTLITLFDNMLAETCQNPSFISSHQDLVSFHLISSSSSLMSSQNQKLSFHQDLVSSQSQSHAKPEPGAPISQRFDPILISCQNETIPEQNILVLTVSLK